MKRFALLFPLALLACDEKKDASPTPERTKPSAAPTGDAKPAPSEDTKPAAAPTVDGGQFAELGKLMNEASDAVEKAARGEKAEGWEVEPAEGADPAKLKDAKRVLSFAEVEAMSDQHGYLRTGVVAFPDGSVRWVELTHKPDKALVQGTPDIDKVSPALGATSKKLIETLSGDGCSKLPILTTDEAAKLPAPMQKDVKPTQPQLDAVCTAMKGKADGWQPRYDDFTVIMQAGEQVIAIKSSFVLEGGKLKLGKPRVR